MTPLLPPSLASDASPPRASTARRPTSLLPPPVVRVPDHVGRRPARPHRTRDDQPRDDRSGADLSGAARDRRRLRARAALLVVAATAASGFVLRGGESIRSAEASAAPGARSEREMRTMRARLTATQEELEHARAELARWHAVFRYSSHYTIPADLAGAIYDIARAEGIEPELGFRLVHLESEFNERARSRVGALGLTQLMPSTARDLQPDVTPEQLLRRDTNLRLGFRYLRSLVRDYQRLDLALLVYNRGAGAVAEARRQGRDPSNGYDRIILRGYRGTGVIE